MWAVKSKRGAFHQVNLKKGQAPLADRQYVEEGVCPRIKAAKEQLKRLALPSEPAEPPKVERPSVASARGKAALGQPAGLLESSWGGRFSGLVAKARGLQRDARPSRGWFHVFADQRGERAILTSPGQPTARSAARGDRPEPLPLEDSKASTPELLPEPSLQTHVELLVNAASQDRILNILAGAGEVMMTAYTFDQPDEVDSLIRRPGVARLLVDRGQSVGERTKLQRQSLLQVARAGIRVRLTAGSSIAEAYAGDRRGTAVGKSFKGIQHSKTFCRRGAEGAPSFLVVGSSNYTTSSRANVELGLLVSGPWEDEVERLWAVSEILGGEDRPEKETKPSRRRVTGKQSQGESVEG